MTGTDESAVAVAALKAGAADGVVKEAAEGFFDLLEAGVRSAMETGRVAWDLTLEADEIGVDPDRAATLGIIVTELIIDAFKHTGPAARGPVQVRLTLLPGGAARLSVEDKEPSEDGRGAPDHSGVGRSIVDAIAAKLGATIVRRGGQTGTAVDLTFPVPATPMSAP